MGINNISVALFGALIFIFGTNIKGQPFFRKPWPTYSLQNMPETRFTCHDKILGGYYADAETQCQMFHVCVKVAGVGVQDFRFLCPNGTAFDQEAQICADWGDVDCDQSVLYYGSDNFDLYRIGSGFESKKAPLAEEEESTFHLQRAESGDIRRSKEKRIDQKSRPDEPPNYTKHFEATPRNNLNNFAKSSPKQDTSKNEYKFEEKKRPVLSYYTPVKTTSTTTTTERYYDDSKQDFEEIFKGSHSSNFFANRNGGREDDFIDHPIKSKLNDFSDFRKKSETSTTGKSRIPTTKRVHHSTTTTTIGTTTSTTARPITTKKQILQTTFNSDPFKSAFLQKSTTVRPITTTTTTTTVKAIPSRSNLVNSNKFNFALSDIQPTTFNPSNSFYKLKYTTPRSSFANHDNEVLRTAEKSTTLEKSKPTVSARKNQKQKLGPRDSTFINHNEFEDFTKVKVQQPQPFQIQKTTPAAKVTQKVEPQFFRSRSQGFSQVRVGNEEPAPFSSPQKQKTANKDNEKPVGKSRGSVNRGSINYKATTQIYHTPTPTDSVVSNGGKKFSTIVPKDLYIPTTFKPTTYQKAYDQKYYLTQQTSRPANKAPKVKPATTASTTTVPTTANPYYNPDEDDGQYHPELYEVDFPRNRYNIQRSSTTTLAPRTTTTISTTRKSQGSFNFQNPQTHLKTQQQTSFLKQQQQLQNQDSDVSDEEELFKTAQSLNFGAASINKLRADIYKAEKNSQQYNSQYSPNAPSTSTTSSPATTKPSQYTTTKTPDFYNTQTASYRYQTTTNAPSTTNAPIPTTTRRPSTITSTTQAVNYDVTKSGKKSSKSKDKKDKKVNSKSSKRPPHADEDTSYDYAYYDSDTLSETPQDYPEYAIAEFSKTRKN